MDLAGWRVPLALSSLVTACLLVFIGRLPESRDSDGRIPDPRGVLVAAAAVALLVLAASQAGRWGWTDARTIGGAATAIAGVAVGIFGFGRPCWRAIDLALLRSRAFAAGNALSVPFAFAAFAWLLAAPLFAASVWGWDALKAALSVSPGAIASALAAWAAGRMPAALRAWAIVAGALVFAGAIVFLIGALDRSPQFLEVWLPAGIFAGAGIGAVLAGLSAIVGTSVPEDSLAEGAAINMTLRQLGGTLGVAVLGALLGTGDRPDPSAFTPVWLVGGLAGLLTAAGGIALLCRQDVPRPLRNGPGVAGRCPSVTLER